MSPRTSDDLRIRPAAAADAAAIAALYAPYVAGTTISFEEQAPDADEMRRRMLEGGDRYPWLVAEAEGKVVGFACACAFRARSAYRFVVETSVYVGEGHCGRGIGRGLYVPLLDGLTGQGFTQAIAAISLPNPASVALHESLGFDPAGVYRQVGWKLGGWIDVGLWQRGLAAPSTPPAEPRDVQRS